MEYTVGSLSDLITGSNTPNKKKVIKQKFVVDIKQDDDIEETSPAYTPNKKNLIKREFVVLPGEKNLDETREPKKERASKKKRKNDSSKSTDETDNKDFVDADTSANKKKKKLRKRKHDEEDEDDQNSVEAEGSSDGNKNKKTRPKSKKQKLDDDDDSNTQKKKAKHEPADPEKEARTIFVGNVPLGAKKSALKKLFSKYGNIDAIRFRGLPSADPKVPKKVAYIKQEFHKDRASCIVYVRFDNAESAEKALEVNGHLFEGHHLKVNLSRTDQKPDESKAIFLGNIIFNAEEEDLWKLFEPCGSIESVRLVRDKRTGMGKGFGYINFKSADAVHLALEMGEVNYKGRALRISMCNLNAARRNKRLNKAKPIKKAGLPRSPYNKDKRQNHHSDQGDVRKPKSATKPTANSFQGSKFTEKKKKNKLNKGALKKKALVKKITPKSKNSEKHE